MLCSGNYDLSCGCKLQLPQLCCGCQLANGGSIDSGVCIDLGRYLFSFMELALKIADIR